MLRELGYSTLVSVALVIGCGGAEPLPPKVPAFLQVGGGDYQLAEVGQALPESLTVRVLSADHESVPGVAVSWSVTLGGGSVSPATSVTDANGRARARYVVGPSAGAQAVLATVRPLPNVPDIEFFSWARVNGAVFLGNRSVGPATDTVLGTNDEPLVVMVTNEKQEPVPGFVVTWTAIGGGGSVSASTQPTDAGGESIVYFTYGPVAGEQYARASAPGLMGSPIDFVMRATAGNPVSIEKVGGDGLSIPAGGQVVHRVIVRDARGNPRNGVAIHWSVGSGGGSITPSQNITGNDGSAEALRTLGPSAGSQTAVATAPDISGAPAVTFTTTVTSAQRASSSYR